jgi:uncharacterized protein
MPSLRAVNVVLMLAAAQLGATAAVAADYAPLDCTKARSPVERTICGNYALGQAEARMATLYEWTTQLVAMGRRGNIQDDQRAFIRARESCGPDLACLLGTYDRRIDQLQMVMDGIKSKGPF